MATRAPPLLVVPGYNARAPGPRNTRNVSCERPRLRAHRLLLATAIGAAVAETALVAALVPDPPVALGAQVSAPEPLGVFHDLRWLLVFHRSWVGFALGALALLAFRSTMSTLLVVAAWPRGVPRPGWAATQARVAGATLLAAVVLTPWAVLLFAGAAISLSWFFYVGVPITLALAMLLPGEVVKAGWWRRRPPARTAGWIALAFVVLSAGGACAVVTSGPLRLLVAASLGLFNAWAWLGIVHAVACREATTRFVPFAPAGILILLGIVVGGTALGFWLGTRSAREVSRPAPAPTPAGGRPVLVVTGFDSRWDGTADDRFGSGFREERFSYRGLSPGGSPLPYDARATHRSIPALVADMRRQVELLHRETGLPVAIAAESEGSVLAKVYVATTPDAPVDDLVMLSPLLAPARVYYPPAGVEGWGVFDRWALHNVTSLLARISPLEVTTDAPFLRSVVDHAPALRRLSRCPVPGVRELVLAPVADSVVAPEPLLIDVPVRVVGAFHGGLLGEGSARALVRRHLEGGTVEPSRPWWAAMRIITAVTAAWSVPTLPLDANPVWDGGRPTPTCASSLHRVRAWIGAGDDSPGGPAR